MEKRGGTPRYPVFPPAITRRSEKFPSAAPVSPDSQRSEYDAVTALCAVMTAVVVILLATHIVEPRGLEVKNP